MKIFIAFGLLSGGAVWSGIDPVTFLILAALIVAYIAMHNIADRGRDHIAWRSRYSRRRSH
jgi:hypothetical protein